MIIYPMIDKTGGHSDAAPVHFEDVDAMLEGIMARLLVIGEKHIALDYWYDICRCKKEAIPSASSNLQRRNGSNGYSEGMRKMQKSKDNVEILLDSGAWSAWTKQIPIKLQDYIDFCLEYLDVIDYIVNLDVIPGGGMYETVDPKDTEESAKQGWQNYRTMIKAGIPQERLIHVFHQGEDYKWLQRMVKEIPYIGIAPAKDSKKEQKIPWMDQCMDYVCDDKGMPRVKFHGFGVTTLPIMVRYPWYSIDSTSWVVTSRTGSVYVPRFAGGKWTYDENSWKVCVSFRNYKKEESGQHITTFAPMERRIIEDYFDWKGFKLGKSEFHFEDANYQLKKDESWVEDKKEREKHPKNEVEYKIEHGLGNEYELRDEINILYFLDLEKYLPPWPWAYKRPSNRGFGF